MAAPRHSGMLLVKAANAAENIFFRKPFNHSRILINFQQTRDRKRSRTPAWWYAKRLVDYGKPNEELTKDSKEFLFKVVEDKYLDKLASPLREEPWARETWDLKKTMRAGVLGLKIGVQPVWMKDGTKVYATLIQIIDNHVINYVPPEIYAKHPRTITRRWAGRYGSVVVGAMTDDPFKYSREYNQIFAASGMPTKRKLSRFLVTPDAKIQPGTRLTAAHFRPGDFVDVQARTIGRGFQGVVKRWGFATAPQRGTTKAHRRPGSLAGGLYKGRKMPGRMGFDWRMSRGLQILRINTKYNVLYVKGPGTPGPCHGYIRVMDTILPLRRREMHALNGSPPMPTAFPEDIEENVPEDLYAPEVFQFTMPSIFYEQEVQQKKAVKMKVKTKGKK